MSQAEKLKQGQFTNPETPGYVGFANLPNQVHRKSVKKGFEFTLMVVGESGLGKSTLINSLFLTDLYPERVIPGAAEKIERTVQIEASTVEIEERGVKLRLTVVDTPGYGDAINSQDCFNTIIAYIDDQFERYLHDESGLNRRHIVDNRVHCCFYFISPLGHGLKPLDVQFMKAIHNKVNVVPVIAKADTLTLKERERLKRRILDEIDEHGIKIYHLPDAESDEDEDFKEQTRILKASIPFAVVGSNQQIEAKGKKVRGRLYPWGVVEVENPEHNDFLKLRTMLITHMQDLQEVTQDLHYENFRSERLKRGGRLSSHGYILPLSPAYVLLCLSFSTSSLNLHEKAELFSWICSKLWDLCSSEDRRGQGEVLFGAQSQLHLSFSLTLALLTDSISLSLTQMLNFRNFLLSLLHACTTNLVLSFSSCLNSAPQNTLLVAYLYSFC
ncbi:septin-2 isoform X1 [Pseudorasbora parva]|uniref:septin-2 isoform X1 n=1 Tax=Pseudorasbora parva TaxID=51549 RepID=UPI00351E1B9B